MMSKAPILIKSIIMVHEDWISARHMRIVPGRVFNSFSVFVDIELVVSVSVSVESGDEIVTIVMSIAFEGICSSLLMV